MPEFRIQIQLHDEAPKLGSGQRRLRARVGRKWVHVSDHLGRSHRFSIQAYEALKPTILEELPNVKA